MDVSLETHPDRQLDAAESRGGTLDRDLVLRVGPILDRVAIEIPEPHRHVAAEERLHAEFRSDGVPVAVERGPRAVTAEVDVGDVGAAREPADDAERPLLALDEPVLR